MNTTKLYDLVVKTGEYRNNQGETKPRYKNVGAVMRNDNGQFLMLDRTFNPAGVPGDRDTVLISMFEPRDNNQRGGYQSQGSAPSGGAPSGGAPGFDDEIPFDFNRL